MSACKAKMGAGAPKPLADWLQFREYSLHATDLPEMATNRQE